MPRLQLPPNPNLDQFKNQARDLFRMYQSGNSDAISRIQEFHPKFKAAKVSNIQSSEFKLTDAQLVIARQYGFDSWAKLRGGIVEKDKDKLKEHRDIISILINLTRDVSLKKESVDLGNFLPDVFARANVPDKVQWQLEFEPSPFILEGDKPKLSQVFDNLISNALDAVEESGELVVKAVRSPKHDIITFQDNGTGIADKHRGNIFEPCFTTKSKGYGLGLWTCSRLIELHGGTITLVDDTSKGATFEIQLPHS